MIVSVKVLFGERFFWANGPSRGLTVYYYLTYRSGPETRSDEKTEVVRGHTSVKHPPPPPAVNTVDGLEDVTQMIFRSFMVVWVWLVLVLIISSFQAANPRWVVLVAVAQKLNFQIRKI